MHDSIVSNVRRNDSLVLGTLYGWQYVGRYLCEAECKLPPPTVRQKISYDCAPRRYENVPDSLIVAELHGLLSEDEVAGSLTSLSDRGLVTHGGRGDVYGHWILPDGRSLQSWRPNHIPYESLPEVMADTLSASIPELHKDQSPFGPVKLANGSSAWVVILIVDDGWGKVRMDRNRECGLHYRLTPSGIDRFELEQTKDGGWASVGALGAHSKHSGQADEPALHDEELAILRKLRDSGPRLLKLYELEADFRRTRKTIGVRVTRLIDLGLAERPRGKHGGVTVTARGRGYLNTTQPAH